MRPNTPKTNDNHVVDTLKIRDMEYQRILGKLDHEAGSAPPMVLQQRAQPRYPHAVVFVIQIHHPGGTCVNYVGRTRNISRSGLAFLHGNFLHNGTRCVISLPLREGKWMRITGTIVRCRHVESKVHELGVHFDEPIDLSDVIQAADEPSNTLTLPFGLGRYLKPL